MLLQLTHASTLKPAIAAGMNHTLLEPGEIDNVFGWNEGGSLGTSKKQ